jgi:hypothetical protein
LQLNNGSALTRRDECRSPDREAMITLIGLLRFLARATQARVGT